VKWTEGAVQYVEYPICKLKALSSKLHHHHQKKEKKGEGENSLAE
jgi:hypothetical protein